MAKRTSSLENETTKILSELEAQFYVLNLFQKHLSKPALIKLRKK